MAKSKKKSGHAKKTQKKQKEAAVAAAAASTAQTNGSMHSSRPAKSQQRTVVKQLNYQADQQGLQVGDKRFLLSAKWWERWSQYVDYDEEDSIEDAKTSMGVIDAPPSKINNLPLLHVTPDAPLDELMGGPLRPQLKEGYHYVLVPQEVWDALVCWYGGGPTIARFVVVVGDPVLGNSFTRVQMYPEQAALEEQEALQQSEAKQNGVAPAEPVKNSTLKARAPSAAAIAAIPKVCGACHRTTGLKRCGSCQLIWYCGGPCQQSHWKYHRTVCKAATAREDKLVAIQDSAIEERRGKMGLRNLGNTCFMNSALQCLSHVEIITQYFLTNQYQKDLNKDNPLGTGGNLALEYDALLKELWFGTTSNTAPSGLKRAIARFAPQFSGFQQHDSQELLAYILDGLHEDLNRVKQKPYTEVRESDGKMDDGIVAKEAWDRHLLRNDSIFVDHVQGQFKSTVVCPICNKVSITFDPFNCIQLELPMQQNRKIEVICVPLAPEKPTLRYYVEVSKKGSVAGLKIALSKMCGIPAGRLVAADIYQSMMYRVIGDMERINRLRDEDRILMYEVDTTTPVNDDDGEPLTLNYGFLYHRMESGLTGDPLLFTFHANTTCMDVLEQWSGLLSSRVTQATKDAPRIPPQMLAQCMYLCDRDGAHLREEPIPASADTKFMSFAMHQQDNELVFISMAWASSLLSTPSSPRPNVERILDHASMATKPAADGTNARAGSQNSISLNDCFRNFIKPETLDQANLWYCSSCKEHRQARKTMEIWKLPDVLILSLKRFEYRNEVLREKLDMFVDFPIDDLDMAPFCLEKQTDHERLHYELFAVSNHYGSMGFGHYTAFAKSWRSGGMERYPGWYSFDDSHVSPAMVDQVKSNAAYILFYKRKHI